MKIGFQPPFTSPGFDNPQNMRERRTPSEFYEAGLRNRRILADREGFLETSTKRSEDENRTPDGGRADLRPFLLSHLASAGSGNNKIHK
jgi:hypothetical protein